MVHFISTISKSSLKVCKIHQSKFSEYYLKKARCILSRNIFRLNSSGKEIIFDIKLKRLQKTQASLFHKKRRKKFETNNKNNSENNEWIDYDYFRNEVAKRIVDRLDDIKLDKGFPLALDIGSGPGYLYQNICSDDALCGVGGIGGIQKLVQVDMSHDILYRDFEDTDNNYYNRRCSTYRIVTNTEEKLPFPDDTFDLVLSSISMHWVNNLDGLFREVKRILKPNGCFLFSTIGGATLNELGSSLILAEVERTGGISSHIGPFVDFKDVGHLLNHTNYKLPTVDIDTITMSYPNIYVLMQHLQRMGEGNAFIHRKSRINWGVFLAAACIYQDMFGLKTKVIHDDIVTKCQGKHYNDIKASIQVIYAIGWKPHESQPKPRERGSADYNLREIFMDKVDK